MNVIYLFDDIVHKQTFEGEPYIPNVGEIIYVDCTAYRVVGREFHMYTDGTPGKVEVYLN